MPLTFSHPAAAIPLARPLGRMSSLSALVIGSMSADFPYYFGDALARARTHSIAGLFLFCLPVSVAAYFFFYLSLRQPLIALLPQSIASRLAPSSSAALRVN